MATPSEIGARIAGALVAAASLGIILYKSLGPLLVGEDTWLIAAIAGAIVLTLAAVIFAVVRVRRRQLASRIRRR